LRRIFEKEDLFSIPIFQVWFWIRKTDYWVPSRKGKFSPLVEECRAPTRCFPDPLLIPNHPTPVLSRSCWKARPISAFLLTHFAAV